MGINEITKGGKGYIGYEYKTIIAGSDDASFYLDAYSSFGWIPEDSAHSQQFSVMTAIKLKRDRKILNKMELTRLQNHFEACMHEIKVLERSKDQAATAASLSVGVTGLAFMGGAVLAFMHNPAMIFLGVLLTLPGIAGWIFPYIIYKSLIDKRTKKIEPLIEQTYDKIHELCEKGNSLL